MSTAFTPGPWKVGDTYTAGWPVKAGGHIVALVQYLGGTEPANANARIIAAAPNMLKALELFSDECEADGHPSKETRLFALAAIAKARGEQVPA